MEVCVFLKINSNFFKKDEKFFETGLGTNFESGIPGDPQDLQDREEEYAHNRKPKYVSKCILIFI